MRGDNPVLMTMELVLEVLGEQARALAGARGSMFGFHISKSQSTVRPSLRANGSRECAPDDGLREAIQFAAQRKLDCFSHSLLAMTAEYQCTAMQIRLRDLAAQCARVLQEPSAPREGVGNAGCPVHPQMG